MEYKVLTTENGKTFSPLFEEVEEFPGKKVLQEFVATTEEELKSKLVEVLEEKGTHNFRVYQELTQEVSVTIGEVEKSPPPKMANIVSILKAPVSMYDEDLEAGGEAYRTNQKAVDFSMTSKEREYICSYKKGALISSVSNGENLKLAGPHNYFAVLVSFDQPVTNIVGSYIYKDVTAPANFKYYTLTPLTESLTTNSQTAVIDTYPNLIKENTYIAWIPLDTITKQTNNNLAEVIYNHALTYGYFYLEETTSYDEGNVNAPKKLSDTTIRFITRET